MADGKEGKITTISRERRDDTAMTRESGMALTLTGKHHPSELTKHHPLPRRGDQHRHRATLIINLAYAVEKFVVLMAKVDASRAVYLAQAEVLVQLVRSWELDAPQHRKWGRVFVAVVSDAPREEIRLSHECGAVGHLPANCSDREHNFMLTVNESTIKQVLHYEDLAPRRDAARHHVLDDKLELGEHLLRVSRARKQYARSGRNPRLLRVRFHNSPLLSPSTPLVDRTPNNGVAVPYTVQLIGCMLRRYVHTFHLLQIINSSRFGGIVTLNNASTESRHAGNLVSSRVGANQREGTSLGRLGFFVGSPEVYILGAVGRRQEPVSGAIMAMLSEGVDAPAAQSQVV
ncbi:uncharacterized protein PITG_09025 [Phytophthora infestans T30-4]|uniref:Uncharacterized protein n=1 Tax=Phytophthora infestans (strain T30-4) TaxID=403677 RepID=D0NDR3_PHYIT|nr:uncharacterized protein PITG_09025 [Phytophthora infestans T30-4]EEY56220.1 conserved hypothetical protein [Phytophthora infestans T30-4]|eukprot:XP_002903050.1 conserved hypothetical protein [Phytophthora infestans T30-4]